MWPTRVKIPKQSPDARVATTAWRRWYPLAYDVLGIVETAMARAVAANAMRASIWFSWSRRGASKNILQTSAADATISN
jgi:hypothetical protein